MTRRITTRPVLALLLALLAFADANAAVIGTFDFRANFHAAVGATPAEDFESIGSGLQEQVTCVACVP